MYLTISYNIPCHFPGNQGTHLTASYSQAILKCPPVAEALQDAVHSVGNNETWDLWRACFSASWRERTQSEGASAPLCAVLWIKKIQCTISYSHFRKYK